MKCALVHDWLVQKGGGESVLDVFMELFEGPIYTLFATDPLPDRPIHTSYLQKIPHIHSFYRALLPFFPAAIESLDLSSYDLILSSSHTVAKGVVTHPGQLHICYCHTPIRCAWDPTPFHLKQVHPFLRPFAKALFARLRKWDQKTHPRVDHFIANSTHVAKRIEACYGRKATVIHPPVDTESFQIAEERSDYYITCSRLVPYKRVDLLLRAFAKLPQRKLLIVGTGPDERKLKAIAPKNVILLGHKPQSILTQLVAEARAFVFAAEEDFGICLVEAQSAGVPVIAYGKGGSVDTIVAGTTGVFFKEQTPEDIVDAICRFEKMERDFEPEKIREHAKLFSKERCKHEIETFITQKIQEK